MRSIRLLTFTALLGAASTAAAWPGPGGYWRRPVDRPVDRGEVYDDTYYGDRERYDRYENWRGRRDYDQRWLTIANMYSAETNRQFLHLRDQVYDKLRIEAVRGAPMINQIAVLYANGTTQVVKLRERLPWGAGEVIRLNREPIRRVVVYTDPRYGGAYSIHVARTRGWNTYGPY
jgi:hypothetical protein